MIKVKIYSTHSCPLCAQAKEFLHEKGIKFKELDVSSDEDAANEMTEKSGQRGVPVIEVDKKIVIGFDKPKLVKLLKLKK